MPYLFALGMVALLLTSCSISTAPRPTPHPSFTISKDDERTPLLVFSHGHHTGLVLPRKAVESALPGIATQLTGDWLEFGWGDEGFYRSEAVTFPLAFHALAYPTPGVMHVVTSSRPLHLTYAYAPAHLFYLTSQQRQTLVQRLAGQFARDEKGQLLSLGPGRYGTSRFYRACSRFFFPRTCNAWTANHLRAIGYKVRAVTAPGLFRELEKLESQESSACLISKGRASSQVVR